jgi:CAAX prenyl protease-like protein
VQSITTIQRWGEHPGFARALPFGLYIAFLALAPLSHGWIGFDVRWLYGFQIAAVALALAWFWRRYAELNQGPKLTLWQWVAAAATGVAVFVLWIKLDQPWATLGASKGFDPRQAGGALDLPLVAMRIFGAAVIVPVMEELFWRSLLMRWIERSDFLAVPPQEVALRAVVMSSVVFGFEHTLWLAGILAGLAYAYLYCWSGRLWAPVIAHAVTNLLLGLWVVATGNWKFW